MRGHEFHHSRLVNLDRGKVDVAYTVRRGYGIDGAIDGLSYKNVLAGYTHLHAVSVPHWAGSLVARAADYLRARGPAVEAAAL